MLHVIGSVAEQNEALLHGTARVWLEDIVVSMTGG